MRLKVGIQSMLLMFLYLACTSLGQPYPTAIRRHLLVESHSTVILTASMAVIFRKVRNWFSLCTIEDTGGKSTKYKKAILSKIDFENGEKNSKIFFSVIISSNMVMC